MKLGQAISWLMGTLQRSLFPRLEECYQVPLTDKERQVVAILELIKIEKFVVRSTSHQHQGRRLRERESIARSFVVKAVYGYPFTRTLIEVLKTTPPLRRICGFERVSAIPSEATFSRAFAEFAKSGLGDRVHDALVGNCLKPELIGHISRDSTAIRGREKPAKKPRKQKAGARKRGRPARGEQRKPKEPERLEKQQALSAEDALKELPVVCDVGTKKDSAQVRPEDLRGLKNFGEDFPESHRWLLYRGRERLLRDGILCAPCEEFLLQLKPGEFPT